jgi:dynein heavy chain 2
MDRALELMPRDSMLAAGFSNYLSAYSEDIREQYLRDWKNSARSLDFDFCRFMSTESKLLKWKTEGLPGDSLSLENGITIFSSPKTSLIIDPST